MNTTNDSPTHPGVARFLSTPHPFSLESYSPSPETFEFLQTQIRVLVVGAGGLGCEVLKNLVISGFTDIHIIDLDTVALTNLNRQFLFRECDITRPKALVAAEAVQSRFASSLSITPHHSRIQDHSVSFYRQFNFVIAGLDSIEARRWLNARLHELLVFLPDGSIDPDSIIPLLDGGSEGFKGQSRVIVPSRTSCFECSLPTLAPEVSYPLCTIAETPRLPEHCIEYAMVVKWDSDFPGRPFDADDPDSLHWVFEEAKKRADDFGISGVTYSLTVGVTKRVVPAISSTNSLVAASLVNEALKLSTFVAPVLNTYMMLMGHEGFFSFTFPYERNPSCLVCGVAGPRTLQMSRLATLQDLLDELCNNPDYRLSAPILSQTKNIIFAQHPPSLRDLHTHKLGLTLGRLIQENHIIPEAEIAITDPTIPTRLRLVIELR